MGQEKHHIISGVTLGDVPLTKFICTICMYTLMALRMTQSIASSQVELHIVLWTPSDKEQPVSTASPFADCDLETEEDARL